MLLWFESDHQKGGFFGFGEWIEGVKGIVLFPEENAGSAVVLTFINVGNYTVKKIERTYSNTYNSKSQEKST